MPFIFKLFQTRVLRWLCVYCYSNWHTCSPLSNSISYQEYYSNWHTFQLCVNTAEQIILHIRYYSQRASPMNAQLQIFIKYFIHQFHFSIIIPSEYMTPENLAKVDDYLNITSRLKRETLHFFDEASVIVTSGNRMLVVSRTTSNWSSKIWIKRQPHGTLPFSSSPMHFWRCSFSSWIALTGIPVRTNLKFWGNNSPTSETMSCLISFRFA